MEHKEWNENCKSTLANGLLKHSSGIYIFRGLFQVYLHNKRITKFRSVHNGQWLIKMKLK